MGNKRIDFSSTGGAAAEVSKDEPHDDEKQKQMITESQIGSPLS